MSTVIRKKDSHHMVALAEHNTGNPQQGNPKEKLSTRNKLIAAFGAGAVSVAAIFGVTHAMGNDEKSVPQENSATHDTPPPSVDVNGNPINELKSPESKVATGETLALLQAHSKNFDEWRGQTLDLLNRHNKLTTEQRQFLEENLATLSQKTDKSMYSDQEVLAAVALDVADASIQDNLAEGHAMLPLIISKRSGQYFTDTDLRLGNGDGAILNIYNQSGPDLPRPKESFWRIALDNVKDARVIIQTTTSNIPGDNEIFTEAGLYVLNSDGNGNEQWQVRARLGLDDPEVQKDVTQLRNSAK